MVRKTPSSNALKRFADLYSLPPLQHEIIKTLAFEGPSSIRGLNKKLVRDYKSMHTAVQALLAKHFLKKAETSTTRGGTFSSIELTYSGGILSLAHGSSTVRILSKFHWTRYEENLIKKYDSLIKRVGPENALVFLPQFLTVVGVREILEHVNETKEERERREDEELSLAIVCRDNWYFRLVDNTGNERLFY